MPVINARLAMMQSIALLSLSHSENRVRLTVDVTLVSRGIGGDEYGLDCAPHNFRLVCWKAIAAISVGRRDAARDQLDGTVEDRAEPSLLSCCHGLWLAARRGRLAAKRYTKQ
jgi:hypothetical protein